MDLLHITFIFKLKITDKGVLTLQPSLLVVYGALNEKYAPPPCMVVDIKFMVLDQLGCKFCKMGKHFLPIIRVFIHVSIYATDLYALFNYFALK